MYILGYNVSDWLLLLIIILTLIYLYSKRHFNFWKDIGIDGPKPYPVVGNFMPFTRKSLHIIDEEWGKKYGRLYGSFMGRHPKLMVADPELIKQVFIKQAHEIFINRQDEKLKELFNDETKIIKEALSNASGQKWKDVRSLLSPTFTAARLKQMAPLIAQCSAVTLTNLGRLADEKETFEAKSFFGSYSLDVIASTMFGLQLNSQDDPDNPFVRHAKKAFDISLFSINMLIFIFFPALSFLIAKIAKISFFPMEPFKFFHESTKRILEMRRNQKEYRPDFLQLMLDVHKEIQDENIAQKGLTDDQILANAVIFFLAGYETTGTLLAWLAYCMAVHPDWQEKVHDEIESSIADGDINYNNVNQLETLDMILNETLRMYPPALRIERIASADFHMAGYDFPKGVSVAVPTYALHYDEEYWPNPHTFDPTRWSPEQRHKISPCTFVPFGVGPRNCIGFRFALMEAKMCMAHILRRYKFVPCSDTHVDMSKMKVGGFLYPKDGIKLQVERCT